MSAGVLSPTSSLYILCLALLELKGGNDSTGNYILCCSGTHVSSLHTAHPYPQWNSLGIMQPNCCCASSANPAGVLQGSELRASLQIWELKAFVSYRCSFSSRDRDVHILLPHNEDDMLAVLPSAAREMFQCFTKVNLGSLSFIAALVMKIECELTKFLLKSLFHCNTEGSDLPQCWYKSWCGSERWVNQLKTSNEWFSCPRSWWLIYDPLITRWDSWSSLLNVMQHPMRQTDELIFKDRVVVLKTALIGVGPTCRGFPWCRPKYVRNHKKS